MSAKVHEKDNGYGRLAKTLAKAAKGATLSVGILAASAEKPAEGAAKGITVGDVATWNEFGLGVPERSFLRAWYDETTAANRASFRKLWASVIKGDRTPEEVFSILGLKFTGDIQRRIVAGINPPNAPATIAAKGSSTPLISTGQLKSSISYEVRP